MEDLNINNNNGPTGRSPNLRDILAIAFRHRRIMVLSFLGTLSGAILISVLQANRYEAAMKILVKRDRVDPIVTPQSNAALPISNLEVSEEELNSEVELLKSRDLLEKIVVACNLQAPSGRIRFGSSNSEARAVPADRVTPKKPDDKESISYVPPRPLAQVLPDTRLLSGLAGASTPDVEIAATIDEAGHVTGAHVLKNPGKPNDVLENAAIQAAKQWIFEPATLDGKAVPSDHKIDFQFRPEARDLANTMIHGNEPQLVSFVPGAPRYGVDLVGKDSRAGAQSAWLVAPAATNTKQHSPNPDESVQIADAVRKLAKQLKAEVIKKTNLISVSYESRNPELAARVLTMLANLYLDKHVAVHRPSGALDFFQRATEQYRSTLNEAEARLVDFGRDSGVVSAPLEKEVALQKLAEFEVALKQTEAAVAETQQRIHVLQQEAASTPSRVVSQVRSADDGALLSQLRSNLLTLEQKHIELLGKFQPSYRLVQETEAQIAQTHAALEQAEKSKLRDETTDRDPTYEWVQSELARAKADLAGLRARAQATAATVWSYQQNTRSLEQKEVVQSNLVRNVKEAEENYLLYLRKEEEARISDALDRGRILNVAIAEAAAVPSLPTNHRAEAIFVGIFLAMLLSIGSAFLAERLDPTFRTPAEIESVLDIPVLAAIPRNGKHGAAATVH